MNKQVKRSGTGKMECMINSAAVCFADKGRKGMRQNDKGRSGLNWIPLSQEEISCMRVINGSHARERVLAGFWWREV